MKTITAIWFTTLNGTLGIVVGESEVTGKREVYIGIASGLCEKVDTERIKSYGSKVSLPVLRGLVALLEKGVLNGKDSDTKGPV